MAAGSPLLALVGGTSSNVGADPQTSGYKLTSAGLERKIVIGSYSTLGNWITPAAAAPGAYEVRATLNSGDTPTGTLATWLALTSDRTWELTQSGGAGTKTCELGIEIRLGAVVLATATVTLDVEVL